MTEHRSKRREVEIQISNGPAFDSSQKGIRFVELRPDEVVISREELRKVIAEVRSWYPTDIFPEDGESLDSKSAKMARITCDNIQKKVDELFGEDKSK